MSNNRRILSLSFSTMESVYRLYCLSWDRAVRLPIIPISSKTSRYKIGEYLPLCSLAAIASTMAMKLLVYQCTPSQSSSACGLNSFSAWSLLRLEKARSTSLNFPKFPRKPNKLDLATRVSAVEDASSFPVSS